MASLSDLYTHLKTLCEQWFYTKTQIDTSLNGKANSTHAHGNITSDGKVGSNANYFVTTTTSGAVTSKQKIGDINTSGQIGSTANLPLITTTSGKVTTGSFGTSANTFCQGNDSRLSDSRTPTAHTHTISEVNDLGSTLSAKLDSTTASNTFAPISHTQSSNTITDSNTYSNIGNTAQTQESINGAINTKLGELVDINFVTVVQTLPTASADTMGKIYLVAISGSGQNNFAEYVTVKQGSTYSWEKFGEVSGSGLSVDWADITGKPSTFTPSSHTHGNILNDGTITTDVTFNSKIVITNSSNAVGTATAIDVMDNVVQQLITYGSS